MHLPPPRFVSQDSDELKSLELELAPVLREINALANKAMPKDTLSSVHIPLAAEIVKMREERARMASINKADAKILGGPKDQKQQAATGTGSTEGVTPLDSAKPAAVATAALRNDFVADDFKSMLELPSAPEEKLSTKAMRKRIGASETMAREEQESIQSDMMSLAKQLKDRTQTINQSLAEDVKILDAVGQSAEFNTTLLDRENAVLKQQLASSIGLWTSLWLVAMLVVVFIVTYFYMKLFSRRW
ncbi:hypothetical protein BBJ28_00019180 [Nothophytophthora sp. Chile5]|nr:hypothetical protein BBJ28_00019180 [Nothophytophthora sp. Chile5]